MFLTLWTGLFGFHNRIGQAGQGEAGRNHHANHDKFFKKHRWQPPLGFRISIFRAM
jgi:hypothetical protein